MVDLNLNNNDVKNEIFNIVDFYLDKGVHGFRVDAVKHFFEGPKVGSDTAFMLELNMHVKDKNPDGFVCSATCKSCGHLPLLSSNRE